MKPEGNSTLPWRWSLLTALLLVGIGMRVFRLTHWGLAHDELFTLRDSLQGGELPLRPKALLFILNHYLVAPFFELDEFGLRVLPLVFGVAGIVVVFFVTSRLFGSLSGFFAAVLVTFAPWHLYWSQNARYQSLLFLLSAGVPVAVYLAVKEEKLKWFVAAALLSVLAILAHPSAAFVVAGAGVWLAGYIGLRAIRGARVSRRVLVAVALSLVLLAGASAFRLAPIVIDRLEVSEQWGIAGPFLLVSFVNWLTPGISLFAAGGVLWMWRDGSRDLALLLVAAVGVPYAALALLGYVLPVSVGYLFCAAPFVMMAAGHFVARLSTLATDPLRSALIGGTCALTLVAGGLTGILSHYMDGGRPDYKGAGTHLEARTEPGDLVVGDETVALRHYLASARVETFRRDPGELDSTLHEVTRAGGRLWIVAWIRGRGGFSEQALGAAQPWVWENCMLDAAFGHARLDYKVDDLHVYRCDRDGRAATAAGK